MLASTAFWALWPTRISASPGLADSIPHLKGARFRNTWQAFHSYLSHPPPYMSCTHTTHTYQFPSSPWASVFNQPEVSALPAITNKQTNEWAVTNQQQAWGICWGNRPKPGKMTRWLHPFFVHHWITRNWTIYSSSPMSLPKTELFDIGWLAERLTSPFSIKIGYIGDKVFSRDIVLPD